ncbi:hypothetical protein I2485_01540 [Nesterenkonia sp. E16_7]|uniref:hypothetical protein n=1 Tax=unclassified Nesterenkonia TaxID=2629769 RepID=UPI001A927364|nr:MULTISPECIES: hypothetical protein [unclassified Nesterenkonia]MBO0596441.1 hypothetical protein [Nesterenkonia sp. E16_10]MBO0597331.1 hypothetical protein [Nesterenkonia sp. E16_7]
MRHRTAPQTASLSAVASLAALALVSCSSSESTSSELSPSSAPETSETSGPSGDSSAPVEDGDSSEQQAHDDSASETDEDPESAEDAESEDRRGPGSGLPPGGVERLAADDFDEDLHGEDAEMFSAAGEGEEVGVAGLDPSKDPIPVYVEPTRSSEVTAELESLDAVNLGGRDRHHPSETDGRDLVEDSEDDQEQTPDGAAEDEGFWSELELADGYGWLHRSAQDGGLYWFGETTEVSEDFAEVSPAQDPNEIAESVGVRATESRQEPGLDSEMGPSWVLVSEPADFDEDFYRIDVTGALDDSVAGQRLFVHVAQAEEGYELTRVEHTLLCSRGVGESGLCA